MSFRFYVAAQIGSGTRRDPLRSKLCDYIVNDGSQDFADWSNPVSAYRFCFADCPTETHAQIAADADVSPLSGELADGEAVAAWLDSPLGNFPGALSSRLEAAGVPVNWIGANTTRRQLWRFISAWHVLAQWMRRDDAANLLGFFARQSGYECSAADSRAAECGAELDDCSRDRHFGDPPDHHGSADHCRDPAKRAGADPRQRGA